tara:strand:- start:666 stop:1064 length:399 start_codon:yes stop_codon:yes gene_type:complete
MKKILLIIVVLLSSTSFTSASEEGVLQFEEFHIKSKGIGRSGPVSVVGEKNLEGTYKNIVVHAFGKSKKVPATILRKIPKYHNGIQLTYEAGYKELGGRSIYIQFQKGFIFGESEKFVFSIDESGNVKVVTR